MRQSWRRNITISLYGGLISAACAASIALVLAPDLSNALMTAVISVIPGVVIGGLVGLVTDLSERLDDASEMFSKIRSTWLYHQKFLDVLGVHKKHRAFTEYLIQLSAVERIWQIPDVSADGFYEILITALRHCDLWEGIHHGSIKKLGFEPPVDSLARKADEYFKALADAARKGRIKAKRILILNKEDERDLGDPEVMRAFWVKTGSSVRTFWISEEEVHDNIAKLGALDDSALHDRELFLQYDRFRRTVRFEADWKMMWVKEMFEKLDEYIQGGPNFLDFTELTRGSLAGLEGDAPEAS